MYIQSISKGNKYEIRNRHGNIKKRHGIFSL